MSPCCKHPFNSDYRKRSTRQDTTNHAADGELATRELVGKHLDLAAGVAEDDGKADGERLVEIGQRVELPFLHMLLR